MDNELIEIIAFSLSVIALFSIFTLSAVKLYFKIRRCFPIAVNCWFCNTWSRVPYDNQNCFDCPNCLQYNGFTEDGDYNKVIEAQHRWSKTPPSKKKNVSNGLCSSCNHNQQLKITQLAKFTPLVEENYDEEIEHFKNQLEKAYELCKRCSHILRTTLLKEKATFFGNHVFNIQKKGKNIYQGLLKESTVNSGSYILKGLKIFQGLLAALVILKVTTIVLTKEQRSWFPPYLIPYLELYQDILSTLSSMFRSQISALNISLEELDNLQILGTFGFFMQLPLFYMEPTLMCIKVNQFLCWSFLALASWTKTQEVLMNLFQIICGCLIFYNSFYEFKTSSTSTKSMKKLPRSSNSSCASDDYSEDEEDFISQCNDTVFRKTKTENITANNSFSNILKTMTNCKESVPNLDIRSSLQDLHLSESKFEFNKVDPLFFSRSSSPREKQGLISPAKLNYFDENPWVAGGFWKSEDGTIIPINQSTTKSYSQSSGFCSQANEKFASVFNSNQFHSLPASIETSLSGDFDRLSLVSKSPYISPSFTPPQSRMTSFSYVSPNNSLSPHNSYGNIWSSNQSLNNFVLPHMSIPQKKYSNLFKFPQVSPSFEINGSKSTFNNKSFEMPTS